MLACGKNLGTRGSPKSTRPPGSADIGPVSEQLRLAAERELYAILASPAFSASPRCSDVLAFIVNRALEGRADELKERTMAAEVFGRDPIYDPKTDGIVRVKANEVRKRLSQYYQTASKGSGVRIDLPSEPTFRLLSRRRRC